MSPELRQQLEQAATAAEEALNAGTLEAAQDFAGQCSEILERVLAQDEPG